VTESIFDPRYEEFRRALATARKTSGFSQLQLAEKLRKPQSYVSKYERGERRLDVLEFFLVAEALGIEPFRFLKGIYGKGRHGRKSG
jgi:transcriptional regulator with XRE-family HTH domain